MASLHKKGGVKKYDKVLGCFVENACQTLGIKDFFITPQKEITIITL